MEEHSSAEPKVEPDESSGRDPSTAAHPSARRGPSVRLAAAVAVAFMALGAWLAVTLGEVADLQRSEQDQAAVRETAGRFATALYSYDHRDLEASKRRVLHLATGAFRKEFEDGFVAIEALVTESEATSRATVSDIFTSSVDDAQATCLVLVDTTVTGRAGRRSESSYTRLSLVKVNDTWRVDGVLSLGSGSAPSLPSRGERPATTTTAPAR